ncbi:MAG TPA: serine/threonine-protein kinase [Candidatus Eisenbacteria bacterium]|nr:serine/threonine-protein kinase [Candidatus Eisenbacteria bacterium]
MPPDRDDVAPTEATPPSAPSHAHGRFLPGTVIGNRYRMVALAGRGGMGEVYRADDLKIGQPVALKFLPADFERDADRLERLLGEVRIARQVSHPNVCRVYDVGEFQGHHFITMEYVDGEDLAALLRRIGRLPQEKALDLTRQIAAGLAAAHVQGIVHRDLKPANIMLDGRGRARITDFGLAAAAEALRGRDTQWGTPGYMAPEQLAGGEITPRTDIYALGLVLYEMFTGRKAFEGSSKAGPGQPANAVAVRPSSFVPGLDPSIDAAILKCLEREPVRRPSSAVELLAALPGGDPLAAAVRAGETPSPEMVAAAGDEGALPSVGAWGLLALAVILSAAAVIATAKSTRLDEVPMSRSPELLRDRAHEITRLLGAELPSGFDAWWFGLEDGYGDWAVKRSPEPPLAVRFRYRQSPRPLVPSSGPFVTIRDPAPAWSGETSIAVDPEGRLLEFSRLDAQLARPDTIRSRQPDWSGLLALTGAHVPDLRPVEPLWTPDVPCDSRAAWVSGRGGDTLRFEAAAWRGRPVWLRTIAPWTRPERDSRVPRPGEMSYAFFVGLVAVTVAAIAGFARHNLRLGRADRRGAFRVALLVFLSFGLAFLFDYRWSLDPDNLWRFLIHQPFFPALVAWLYYVGIEPFIRRRWPHRLVAWTRLLEGRFRDPLVGRDVLIGVVAGAGIQLCASLPVVLAGRHDMTLLLWAFPLGRAADFWGWTISSVAEGLMRGTGCFVVLLLLRVLFRRDGAAWAGVAFVFLLLSIQTIGHPSIADWVGLVLGVAIFVLAARVGLLVACVTWTVLFLLEFSTALTLDPSRWYAWRTGVVAAILLSLALWGFRAAMGRRKILSVSELEG